jgi:uncharacterized protein YndB with AHSA1/START domain
MKIDRRKFVGSGMAIGIGALGAASTAVGAPVNPIGLRAERSEGAKGKGELVVTNVMPAPVDRTWRAFTDPQERKIWWGHPTDPLDGALEVRPQALIRGRVDHPGLPGAMTTATTFKAVSGGTLVTQVQSGFGEGPQWESAMQSVAHGMGEMMGDMALYLKTGVGFPRHVVFSCFDFLQGTLEVPGGLEVYEIPEGSLPDQLGMQPGDIVVGLAGAGVYGLAQIHFATRSHAPGDEVEVKWVREGKLMSGTGRMTKIVAMRQKAS